MATKVTYLFELDTVAGGVSQGREAGWSESFYRADDPSPGADGTIFLLGSYRAALLGATAVLQNIRIQQTDGVTVGPSRLLQAFLQGAPSLVVDQPQNSIRIRLSTGGSNSQRTLILRGIPDDMVKGGTYTPTAPFAAAVNDFYQNLNVGAWCWRGVNVAATATPVLSVSAAGVITGTIPLTFVVGQRIQVLRTVNACGQRKGLIGYVIAAAGGTATIGNWTFGDCTGGKVRAYGITFPAIAAPPSTRPITATVRKVGRPFDLYVGRRKRSSR